MFTDSVLLKILIGVIYGIVLGAISTPLSKKLILNRSEDPVKAAGLDKTIVKVLSIIIGVIISLAVVFTSKDTALMIRNLLMLIPIASIAIVDSLIRKIPNSLLLVMIIFQAVYLTYYSIDNHTTQKLLASAFGFFMGFLACTIPSLLRVPVGSGDVKYSAVIGLFMYFTGYLQSMVLMGITAIICLVYLKATKKGGLKTLIPMGPLISVGTVITICFPFLELLIGKVYMF